MIAVSGIGIVSAMGIGVEENLKAFREGRSGISPRSALIPTRHDLPVGELLLDNRELCRRLGVDYDIHISRTALLGAFAVKEALADAGVTDASKVGFISATSVGGMDLTERFFPDFMEAPENGDAEMSRMHDCGASTAWIAEYAGIGGYRSCISTACSSAANAIMMGARMIEAGLLDTVVVGGTDALSMFTINGFKSLMILDSQPSRPFDRDRAGLNLGEGAGYIVLQNAGAMRKEAYCYLAGYDNSNDAHHQTASSAEGDGDYLAMTGALTMAGLRPEEVDYINVHGTGTGNNDQSEGTAMRRVWGDKVPPFSSTKGFTGHTLAAAGGIEAVLSVLSISKGIIWPNLRFKTPIEGLELVPETEFVEGAQIRSVVSNSFGFGGNCSSLVFRSSVDCPLESKSRGKLECYVMNARQDFEAVSDIKDVVTDAGMRRRMGKMLRTAVCTMDSCFDRPTTSAPVTSIVTATGLGCLSDSEKFLSNVIRDREELLNPTPFIQSTFNTIGGQIALLEHNHCYNMTFVNRGSSFEDAMLDVMLRSMDTQNYLSICGAFDENIPASEKIMERLGVPAEQDGSVFLALTANLQTGWSLARITFDMDAEPFPGVLATPEARMVAEAVKAVSEGTENVVRVGRLVIERV